MVYSKISDERVVLMEAWRTHERQRVGGSQRSEGHGYSSICILAYTDSARFDRISALMVNFIHETVPSV
jgi:hypothetical protein